MRVSNELESALTELQNTDFKTASAYDGALHKLKFMLEREHKRLTTSEDGTRLSSVVRNLSMKFVVDNYFGGVEPLSSEREYRKVIERLRSALMGYLKSEYGINVCSPVYYTDIECMQNKLHNVSEIKQAIDSSMSAQTRELVELYRDRKVGTM